jgi:hypothetical protein
MVMTRSDVALSAVATFVAACIVVFDASARAVCGPVAASDLLAISTHEALSHSLRRIPDFMCWLVVRDAWTCRAGAVALREASRVVIVRGAVAPSLSTSCCVHESALGFGSALAWSRNAAALVECVACASPLEMVVLAVVCSGVSPVNDLLGNLLLGNVVLSSGITVVTRSDVALSAVATFVAACIVVFDASARAVCGPVAASDLLAISTHEALSHSLRRIPDCMCWPVLHCCCLKFSSLPFYAIQDRGSGFGCDGHAVAFRQLFMSDGLLVRGLQQLLQWLLFTLIGQVAVKRAELSQLEPVLDRQ